MVRFGRLQYIIDIPKDVTLTLIDSTIKVKGKLGQIEREFNSSKVIIDYEKNKLILTTLFPRKKEKALIGTFQAHIKNMILGVQYGYKYYLKIVFSHFPIRVKPERGKVKIENLYGGRKPRYAIVLPGVKVKIDGDDVIVEGIDKEAVGQTSANIQELTRQRGKRRQSPKTFMDGVFIYNKDFQNTPSIEE